MTTLAANDMQSWKISYNPHLDLFQIFDEAVFHTPDKQLKVTHVGDAILLFLKSPNRPMLVELRDAYNYLGDIDNMSKADIIQTVIGYIESHAE